MAKSLPPFRADTVGSLLRTQRLKQARQQFASNEINAAQLRQIENEEIKKIVASQEHVGLQAVTDGEFRRAWWHFDFLEGLDGVEGIDAAQGIQFNGVQTKARSIKVTGKLGFSNHPMLEDFRYLKSIVQHAVPKMTIPSPSMLHFRGGRAAIDSQVYPDIKDYFADLAETYRQAIHAFYDAGCRYLQLDDTVWAYFCSEQQRQQIRERGEDPEQLAATYAWVINTAIKDKPSDLIIGLHVCRGNFRSTWISEGGYEPVAELLFGSVNVDAFFLEYDSERAGGFEPLRFIKPGHQQVVLGLVTTKTGQLENPQDVKRRIQEAAQYVDINQLCLSPQCGFASTEEGNLLAEEEQWNKLKLTVEVAKEVWGE
ncbi:5-methyltetrahydropteroyltriglutamate--homocysteine methyltransferase [Pragia fontium]|uniref:cobalamin-independent methionine synthase II family protein n=1 Tax=Pragia fontium TaxID=82985 RepID=UPI00064B41E8|nr:cobalamin-independent methionine synthase II family protein [Pragia fontium]AKJ43228.1 methionine synthase [Pragia fontium]SUB83671.1 5-methyltetrahydropteroyltriglutamate--homocysteine methyltransferase [Pragia fontium]